MNYPAPIKLSEHITLAKAVRYMYVPENSRMRIDITTAERNFWRRTFGLSPETEEKPVRIKWIMIICFCIIGLVAAPYLLRLLNRRRTT